MIKLERSLIIDNGTYEIKAGWCSSPSPSLQEKSTYKNARFNPFERDLSPTTLENLAFSHLYSKIKKNQKLIKPGFDIFEHGKVKSQEGLCKTYEKILLKNFNIDNSQRSAPPVLILESSNIDINSKSKKEFISWIFEKMNISVLGIASQVVMDLFATGLTSGLVVDSGHGHTQIAPIIEGYILKHYQINENISGNEINRKIQSFFLKNDIIASNKNSFYDSLKKKSKGVFENPNISKTDLSLKKCSNQNFSQTHSLPDGTKIDLGFLSILYNYDFFNPHLKGSPSKSLPYLINKSIKLYNEKIQKLLTNKIVICGGNANIRFLSDLIVKEINKMDNKSDYVRVGFEERPEFLAWKGGSIVSQLPNCNAYWITKSEYEEEGECRVLKRKLANAPNFL